MEFKFQLVTLMGSVRVSHLLKLNHHHCSPTFVLSLIPFNLYCYDSKATSCWQSLFLREGS